MKLTFFAFLIAASAQAVAQNDVLVSPLPDGVASEKILQTTRDVLGARGWKLIPEDASTIEARKQGTGLRIFIADKALRFTDRAQESHMRQRNREPRGPRVAVAQEEIDALRADLTAALAGNPPVAGASPATPAARLPSQMLLALPAGADPEKAMEAARNAFAGRKWQLSRDADGTLVARNHSGDIDATLRVFVADGALRFNDRTVDRRGRSQVPERWLNYIRADLKQPLAMLAQPAAAKEADPAERMRRLKSMLDAGLITQAEYDAKRAEILKGL